MNLFLKTTTFALAIAIAGTGCKKFVDVNQDPNNLTSASSKYVFTNALQKSAAAQAGFTAHHTTGAWTGLTGHSTSFTGAGAEKTYTYTAQNFNVYSGYYDNLADYQYVVNNATADGVKDLIWPAKVMKCYMFQKLVDAYGDVPYSQFNKGASDISPAFDKQQTIYEDLVKVLDSAINNMSAATFTTESSVVRQDVMFQMNKDKWIRFANSVKLRILMRQSFMPGRDTYITQNINSTLSKGYMQASALVQPGYQKLPGKLNPFYGNYYNENDLPVNSSNYRFYKMGAVLINWLKTSGTGLLANADTFRLQSIAFPRGSYVTAPSATLSNYVGVPLGATSTTYNNAGSSGIGPYVVQLGDASRPSILMTLADSYFDRAEAAQRYSIAFGQTAQQLYESGIISDFAAKSVPTNPTGTSITTAALGAAQRYIARNIPNVGWAASTDKIKAILIQNWVALADVDGSEAWAEYRKSSGSTSEGVPASVRTTSGAVPAGKHEPYRFIYPQIVYDANGANVPTVTYDSRIFWDVN